MYTYLVLEPNLHDVIEHFALRRIMAMVVVSVMCGRGRNKGDCGGNDGGKSSSNAHFFSTVWVYRRRGINKSI